MLIANGVCKNCRVPYLCQLSGHWSLSTPKEYNDREYCPECKKAIMNALSKIKPKFTEVWVGVDRLPEAPAMTVEQLKAIEHQQMFRRVFPTLFDPKACESQEMGEVIHGGFTYRYDYWPSRPDSVRIVIRAERNAGNGEIVPWRAQEGIKV
jgi:hypothetical protein